MNFNDTVEITLTNRGKEILRIHENNILKNFPPDVLKERLADENNKLKLPLWEVAYIFGHDLVMGGEPPFLMNFKFVEEL